MSHSPKKTDGDRTVIITQEADLSQVMGVHEPYLIQISGRDTGQLYHLASLAKNNIIRMGRDLASEIVLEDPHVSRLHAEIAIKSAKELWIRDQGSTNGVFINGRRIQERQLEEGDKILIGTRVYFKFTFQDSVDQSYQQSLFQAANMDSLTGIYNKKFFLDALSKEFSYSRRTGQPTTLVMMDIDYFKKINDTHGHVAGDAVLKALGGFLQKNLRLENLAARFGGEEFSVILRDVSRERALPIAERLRQGIEQLEIPYLDTILGLTVSIGAATSTGTEYETLEDLIRAADESLYEAKKKGRNRTIVQVAT